ncbi:MAG: hypothetical protein ACK5Q5_05350, partial [Planctomycetaceae bacterium]
QSEAMSRPWSRREFPAIARWVDAHAEVLDEVHAACLRPKTYAPLIAGEDRPAVVQILLPHVQQLRAAARLLSARAMLRLSDGDIEGSWQDLTDLQRLARHSEQGFTLIEALVGYAIRSIALQPTAHWIARCGLSPEELTARRTVLNELTRTSSLARSMDCERYMYLDTVISLMSGAATPGATMGLLESTSPNDGLDEETSATLQQLRNARDAVFQLLLLGSDVNETLRYGNGIYDDLVTAMQPESHAERRARLREIDKVVAQNATYVQDTGALVKAYLFSSRQQLRELPAKALTGLLMPAVTAVETAQTKAETNRALLDAAMAVQIHFNRTGEIPLSISELKSLDGSPLLDPFNGEPLRMEADARGLILYGVGINGRDDGGQTYREGEDHDDLRIILPLAP